MTAKYSSGAHALLITPDGKIVLEQKSEDYIFDSFNKNKLSMYGGGIDPYEKPLEALRRELNEELKFDLHSDPEELGVYKKNMAQDGTDVKVHVFIVRGVDPETLSISTVDRGEGGTYFVIDTIDNFLKNSNVSRITKLALEDLKSSA